MPTRPPAFRPRHQPSRIEVRREADSRRKTAYERGYDRHWNRARLFFLRHHPLCMHCLEDDLVVSATVVDHIVPHRGDRDLFWDTDNWQSLCAPCHNGWKHSQEAAALSADAAARANPVLAPSRIPLTIVCGAPGSGKSTYVARHAGANDVVIDLDVIRARLAGTAIHEPNPQFTARALEERNRILASLAVDTRHAAAWFIVSAPEASERAMWARKLGAAEVVVMPTPMGECLRRIEADPSRIGQHARMAKLVEGWFSRAAA